MCVPWCGGRPHCGASVVSPSHSVNIIYVWNTSSQQSGYISVRAL